MKQPIVIYGPPGCGKTTNAEALRRLFGAESLVDDWDGRSPLRGGALALTNDVGPESCAYSAMSFAAAKKLLEEAEA